MNRRNFTGAIVGVALLAGCGKSETDAQRRMNSITRQVVIKTADGWTIHGDLYAPPAAAKGAVILLHQRGGSAKDWQPLCAALEKAGITALAIDQRGAGRSTRPKGPNGDNAPWNTGNDIAAALDSLPAGQPAALAGASYGANNALIFAAAHAKRVRGVALFSPGANYNGLDAIAPAKRYRGPILLWNAANDSISGNGPQRIHDSQPANRTFTVLPGSAHGTGLLRPDPIAKTVAFFDRILR